MQFLVHDRESIERGIVVKTAYVLISIRDPDRPEVRVRRPGGRLDVLFLAFHDAEPVSGSKLPNQIRLMQPDDATKIWNFAQQCRSNVATIVCHCEQGMSRSPAVAIALAEALCGDADAIRAESQPNQYVYELLRDTIAHSAGEE
jgi:predicted protein tyrosine phosphatase